MKYERLLNTIFSLAVSQTHPSHSKNGNIYVFPLILLQLCGGFTKMASLQTWVCQLSEEKFTNGILLLAVR